jgi:hypothetical protein
MGWFLAHVLPVTSVYLEIRWPHPKRLWVSLQRSATPVLAAIIAQLAARNPFHAQMVHSAQHFARLAMILAVRVLLGTHALMVTRSRCLA